MNNSPLIADCWWIKFCHICHASKFSSRMTTNKKTKTNEKKITRLQSVFFQVLAVVINLSGRLYIVPTKYDKHCLLKWGILHSLQEINEFQMPQYAYKTHPAIHFIKRWVSCGIWRRWGPSNSNYTAVHHSDFFNRSIILCGIREREIKLHNCLVVFSHCMNFSFLSLLDSLTTDCMVIDVLWKSGAR